MKTIIYSTKNTHAIADFRVDDQSICSIVNKTKDKYYFRFLYLHQKMQSYYYPPDLSKVLMRELSIDVYSLDNTTELDQLMLTHLDSLFEKSQSSKYLRAYINSFFKRHQLCFECYKGEPVMVLSQNNDVNSLSKKFTHELIEDSHCYTKLDKKQTIRLYKMFQKSNEENKIKLVYVSCKHTQLTFNVETSEQAASVLNMKEDVLYYEFLLHNQKTKNVMIGPDFVGYILAQLNLDYVECPTSSCLDILLIDKAEQLFDLAKTNHKIKNYLSFNFRILHRSFINTVLKPLMVISNQDDCKDLPDSFAQQSINKSVCYYDKRISQKDIHSIFDSSRAT